MNVKKDFPIFKRKINGMPLIYIDNAATTQKPKSVIKTLSKFYEQNNATIHRGLYVLSQEATEQYEKARDKVAKFINAEREEVVFVKNGTEAINLVAYSLGRELLEGDEIVVTVLEHHSNFIPWQQIAKDKKCVFKVVDIDSDGKIDFEDLKKKISSKTKIVAVTHASNVLGIINDVKKIASYVHSFGAYLVVDGAQSIPRMKIDVKDLECDFFAFSSHKMLGPMGVGVLYGKKELLEKMHPFLMGGNTIKKVEVLDVKWNDLPWKFEAGIMPVPEVIALGEAVDYLTNIGMEKIHAYEEKLTKYAVKRLKEIPELVIYGSSEKVGVVPFNISDLHPHDVATILDRYNICIRAGHHCAQPLMNRLGILACCRVSFYIYNSKKDIDALIEGLKKVREVMKCEDVKKKCENVLEKNNELD